MHFNLKNSFIRNKINFVSPLYQFYFNCIINSLQGHISLFLIRLFNFSLFLVSSTMIQDETPEDFICSTYS